MPNTNRLRGAFASAIFVVSVFFVSSCQENVSVPIADEAKQDLTKPSAALTVQQKQQIEDVQNIIRRYMKESVAQAKEPKDNILDMGSLAGFVNNELAKQKKPLVKFFSAKPNQSGKEKTASLNAWISVYAMYDGYGYKTKFAVGYDINDHALFNYGFAPVYWYVDYWMHGFSLGWLVKSEYVGSANISFAIPYVPSASVNANSITMTAYAYDTQGYLSVGVSEFVWYGIPQLW